MARRWRIIKFNNRPGGEPTKLMSNLQAEENERWKRSSNIKQLEDPIEAKLASRLSLRYVEGKKTKWY